MSKITFSDERTQLTVEVRPATFRDDIKRITMQEVAMQQKYDDPGIMGAATFTYPRLMCCTTSGELIMDGVSIDWPPTLDQVLDMSVGAANAWYAESRRCNKDWFEIEGQLGADGEKKVPEKSPTKD